MAACCEAVAAADAVKERLEAARDQITEGARHTRRLVAKTRHAMEDGAEAIELQVRRRPFGALAVAAAAGVLAGAALALILERKTKARA